MSPTSGIAASQLRQLTFYHLDVDLLDNANFLAGRLHALEPRNPDNSHLVALTYLRQRRFKAAYDSAHKYGANGRHLGCAYVFAQSCLELRRASEGTAALEKAKGLWQGRNNWNKHSETSRRHLPDAAAVYTLLAKLWRAYGDWKKAGDYYTEAHKANPFIWEAFDGLCKIGADLNVPKMFQPSSDMMTTSHAVPAADLFSDQVTESSMPRNQPNHASILTPSNDPFNGNRVRLDQAGGHFVLPKVKGKSALANGLNGTAADWDTPTANGGVLDEDISMGGSLDLDSRLQAAPLRRPRPGEHIDASDRVRGAIRGQPQLGMAQQDALMKGDLASRKVNAGGHKRTISGHTSQASSAAGVDASTAPRRSNRLFGQNTTSRSTRSVAEPATSLLSRTDKEGRPARAATGAKGRLGSTVGRVVSGNRKIMPPDPAEKEKERIRHVRSQASEENSTVTSVPAVTSMVQKQSQPSEAEILAEQQATAALLGNLRQLATGCYASSRFELPLAIQTFRTLPTAQRETPWVLAQLGKAYYEAADYRAAEICFLRLLKLEPSRIEDLEVYSTVLWHLKKDTALAFLCHSLRDLHFDSPETWCAVGNAFSLSREHDQAIAAFKRATQLDERFAYAWTLMGHEYIANEEYDAALHAFRKSVAADRRVFGGWYGLGRSLERMGKLEDAERHFRIAASINPSNATLLVCIGVVLEKLHNKKAALAHYTRALELAPDGALARFKKARVLMHMRHYEQALEDLEVLRDQAPDEANVWFLLGKCYKGLGEKGEALRSFTTALNLDVKASPFIKEAMENLDDEDDIDTDDE